MFGIFEILRLKILKSKINLRHSLFEEYKFENYFSLSLILYHSYFSFHLYFRFLAQAYFESHKTTDGVVREILKTKKWSRTRLPKPRGIKELIGTYVRYLHYPKFKQYGGAAQRFIFFCLCV